jgi:toxin ParE1/3/4
MTPYQIAPRAQRDQDEIWSYMADDSPASADGLIELFHEKFLLLSSQPLMGEVWPQLTHDLRSFCVGNYVVFYRPAKDDIEVVRVLHAARDIGSQF